MKYKELANTIFSRLQNKSSSKNIVVSKEEIKNILHELDVYDAELLAQKEELEESNEKLILSNENYNQLFENSYNASVLVDERHVIKKSNRKFRDTFLIPTLKRKYIILDSFIQKDSLGDFVIWKLSNELFLKPIVLNLKCNDNTFRKFKVIVDSYPSNKDWFLLTFVDVQKEYDLIEENRLNNDKILQQEKILLAQSKVAAVGEMLGNISHQWKQPLSAITTQVSGIKVQKEMGLTLGEEKIINSCDLVLSQSQYLSTTINDFLTFFSSDSSTINKFNLKDTLKTLHSLIKDNMKDSHVKFFINSDEYILKNNENLLIQALLNISNNAKDAMVENIDEHSKRFFFIDTKKEDENIILTLKDSGYGIKDNILLRVFEPYFSTKHATVGTGIGLYMTHQIITRHFKGKIEVYNVEYEYNDYKLKGAEFKITLPTNI